MEVNKSRAFLLCLLCVMFIFVTMFAASVVKDKLELVPVGACLAGVGSLAGLYIAGSVANNGVKGANWNQDMYDSENKTEGNK